MIYYDRIEKFLKDAKKIEQTSNYHLENLYVHTIKCANYLLQKTNSKTYVLAGLLHDTGKIQTRRYNEKKGWTFYGHERVSARNLDKYISKDDILYQKVYDIIYCHMMYYNCKGSELKFLKNHNYDESFEKNVRLFNDGDENACIRDEKDLIKDEDCDIIKDRLMEFLKNHQ